MEIAISNAVDNGRNKMAFEQRDMSGAFFKNDKKGNEKAPVYKGKINIEGKEYPLAGWVKEGKNGKFLALKVEKPYKKEEQVQKHNQVVNNVADSLPF